MKHNLESLTKTSVTDLGEGLVELFHSVLGELIQTSRSARNMSAISNIRTSIEGDQVSQLSQSVFFAYTSFGFLETIYGAKLRFGHSRIASLTFRHSLLRQCFHDSLRNFSP